MNRFGQPQISTLEYVLVSLAVATVIVIGVWSLNNALVAGETSDAAVCDSAQSC